MPNKYNRNPLGTNQFTGKVKREIILVIGPSIAYVPLTRGLFCVIEVEDIEKVMQWNWQAQWSKTTKSFTRFHTIAIDG